MQRSAVKPERLIHSTWRYFAGGGTTLVYDQKVVTASTCYTSRFRFTALSSSSFLLLLLLLFSSASLAGFHLECTSNSLGATSLWAAGLAEGNSINPFWGFHGDDLGMFYDIGFTTLIQWLCLLSCDMLKPPRGWSRLRRELGQHKARPTYRWEHQFL